MAAPGFTARALEVPKTPRPNFEGVEGRENEGLLNITQSLTLCCYYVTRTERAEFTLLSTDIFHFEKPTAAYEMFKFSYTIHDSHAKLFRQKKTFSSIYRNCDVCKQVHAAERFVGKLVKINSSV